MNGLRKRILHKLRSNAGESIAETLIAVLISALALVMLAGAVTSAANMITMSDDKLAEYYENDAELAAQSGTESLSITIKRKKDDDSEQTIEERSASYTENDAFASKPVVAYKIVKSTT